MAETFYILDGHYQIYRAYYAPFARLTAPTGEPTKAVHAFCQTLFNIIKTRRPDYLAMAMDVSDETVFRRDIDPQYKAHREPPPEDFTPQKQRILEIVEALGIPILTAPTFEADDIMATIARTLAERDIEIFLVSADKDLEQLITEKVKLYDAAKDIILDADTLTEKKGYRPDQAVEIQTLTGDSTDNIPGVVGVGIKKATKLIQEFQTADAVLRNADQLTPKLRENLIAFADRIATTRRLVTLRNDLDLDFDLDRCRLDRIDTGAVKPIFDELALTRLTEQIDTLLPSSPRRTPDTPTKPAVPPEKSTTPQYTLVDTPESLTRLAAELKRRPIFAFDTETRSLRHTPEGLVGISVSWQPGTGHYIPIQSAMGRALPLRTVHEILNPIFADPDIKKCAHNLKFDILSLRRAGFDFAGAAFDTMIASFVLDPLRPSHGLKQLAAQLLGIEMTPITDLIGRGKHQTTIDQIDTARVGPYASADADCTFQLYLHFKPLVENSEFRGLFFTLELPLVGVLADMESAGVAIDTSVLAEMSARFEEKLAELIEQIHRCAGRSFNIDSPKQLAEILFDEQGLPVVRKTKTGRSTDAEVLAKLAADSDNPIPPLILEYRELSKLKSTYVDPLPHMVDPQTNRIHASFHQTGAVTGRLSSSNPNLQNIPIRTTAGKQIRRAFVPGNPTSRLIVADYSQIELRILTHFSRDDALRQAFDQNQDIHTFVAAQLNGVPIERVTPDQRSAAKAVNFGIIYGQTPFGLSRALKIPLSAAKEFIETFFLRYPGIQRFIDECIEQAKDLGYVETIMGRRRPVPELHSRNQQRAALGRRVAVNTVIQGSAADLIKKAMIDIHQAIRTDHPTLKMLIQVHDELVFESPESDLDKHMRMIRKKMTTALPLDVPIVVDINTGKNWLDSK